MAKKLLNITEIEDRAKNLIENLDKDNFISDFVSLFDITKTTITRASQSADENFRIKNKLHFRKVGSEPLLALTEIEKELEEQARQPRFIVTTDFQELYAKDTKTSLTLAISFEDLPAYCDFFLPWNGIEKVDYDKENPADVKAAERFTKLYDELVKINPELALAEKDGKSFNLFLIRVLFLLFAEDTNIISKGLFTNVIKTRTAKDGSDLNEVIHLLFQVLDKPEMARQGLDGWLTAFPYVNGKLFSEPHHDLTFNAYTRKLLIEAGELLKWNEINPDILGSMIQTVANAEARSSSGMHYTSVPNIMKVIKPLFLDSLQQTYKELEERADYYIAASDMTEEHRRKELRQILPNLDGLLNRMAAIKFLDPACGSGNFLIITYKELRRLEINILQKMRDIRAALNEKGAYQGEMLADASKIQLHQFSGIELDDFAHEVARLSLYIAEHQMNVEMEEALADFHPKLLPLRDAGNIICGNALRIDWEEVLEVKGDEEVYIFGNPPYIGSRKQSASQKVDMDNLFVNVNSHRQLDYIAGWFIKGARFINHYNARIAFVTTNSINQGQQVAVLWPEIFSLGVEISFAYASFKWNNSAAHNAGVTVSIIGLSHTVETSKYLFSEDGAVRDVDHINAYLTEGEDILVSQQRNSLSEFPTMYFGNQPNDGGGLILSVEEYHDVMKSYPELSDIIKIYGGGQEFINGGFRYVIWLNDKRYNIYKDNQFIIQRIEQVRQHRLASSRTATNELASTPWLFGFYHDVSENTILVPCTSSESREYVPMGFVGEDTVISNSAMAIYNAPIWLLGVLQSKMHMVWLRAIGGKLETRLRYSAGLVYNTFPLLEMSSHRKTMLEEAVFDMLDVREEEGGTLDELYGGANKPMNERLRKAHEKIDGIVERAYQQKPFESDEERLSVLLKLYKEMTEDEK
ncbi:Type II restriction enzyme, methylase subunit YeeA [Streptococcus sp. DD11]|uniref:class I SAM-dependent DNA methyltransferase n=1 Tax=Streptococcus sp. DD11 TaxID=1777879 RepID=UPI0007994BF6|nr:DNA methyltransferase [Streptococcus sp. DD11]KXT77108.1 Type II restriction enzyme, methylase subunit YeeA [Streptococcus sp. DD11]